MADYFDGSMGSIWVQPDGPGTAPQYLGCHDLGDISEPAGDTTKRYCPDRRGAGRWTVAHTSRGVPGDVTSSINAFTGPSQDYLQQLANKAARCPFPIYIHEATCGRKDVYNAYEAGTLLQNCEFGNRTKSNAAQREASDATEIAYDLTADNPFQEYWKLRMSRITTTETEDASTVSIDGEDRCQGNCGDEEEHGDEFSTGTLAPTGAAAGAEYSLDGGSTITAMAAQPFGNAEDISCIISWNTGNNTVRHLAARGTTDGANPAEVGYTDNLGTAWTNANVGSTNGEFIPWNTGLFALDEYFVWACTDTGAGAAGNIYQSQDGGATWTQRHSGAGDALNSIHFMDRNIGVCVGDTNEILSTTDGGLSWSSITGPAAKAAVDALGVHVFSRYRWQIVYEDASLYQTFDGGTNWTLMSMPTPSGATAVDRYNSIHFIDDHHGVIAVKYTVTAAVWGAIFRTVNGGYNWEVYTTDAAFDVGAIGMAQARMAEPNLAYGVGDLTAATATYYKLSL